MSSESYYAIFHKCPANFCLILFPDFGYVITRNADEGELKSIASEELGYILYDLKNNKNYVPEHISFSDVLDMSFPGDAVYEIVPGPVWPSELKRRQLEK